MFDYSVSHSDAREAPVQRILSSAVRRAARVHACAECSRGIQLGQKYRKVALVEDGFFVVSKTHQDRAKDGCEVYR